MQATNLDSRCEEHSANQRDVFGPFPTFSGLLLDPVWDLVGGAGVGCKLHNPSSCIPLNNGAVAFQQQPINAQFTGTYVPTSFASSSTNEWNGMVRLLEPQLCGYISRGLDDWVPNQVVLPSRLDVNTASGPECSVMSTPLVQSDSFDFGFIGLDNWIMNEKDASFNFDYDGNNGNNHLVLGLPDAALPPPTFQAIPPPSVAAVPTPQVFCTQGCTTTFKRDTDRVRHEAAVHGINQLLYLCDVTGCPKSIGRGYTRKDKLTEHMWKKHAGLGYVKRV